MSLRNSGHARVLTNQSACFKYTCYFITPFPSNDLFQFKCHMLTLIYILTPWSVIDVRDLVVL